jgi:hypothetical protein
MRPLFYRDIEYRYNFLDDNHDMIFKISPNPSKWPILQLYSSSMKVIIEYNFLSNALTPWRYTFINIDQHYVSCCITFIMLLVMLLWVYIHTGQAWKICLTMHGGNRTYDLWILRPVISSTVMILVHFHIIGLNTPFRKVLGVGHWASFLWFEILSLKPLIWLQMDTFTKSYSYIRHACILQLALRGPNLPASLEVCKLRQGTTRHRRNFFELCFILLKLSVR